MFCEECGSAVPGDSKFCEACGTRVASGSAPEEKGASLKNTIGAEPLTGALSPSSPNRLLPSSGALFFVGGVMGVILVRAFFLDGIEELGWRLFWEGLSRGQSLDMNTVLQSSTFGKCLAGFLACGFLGAMTGLAFQESSR